VLRGSNREDHGVTQKPLPGAGRRPGLAAELDALGDPGLVAGRVLAQNRGQWLVAVADRPDWEPRLLPARGRLRGEAPVTGDWVAIDAAGAIAAVLERHCLLERRAAGDDLVAQALAANVDLVLVVEALPEPNERRAERFAALAAASAIPAALILTKADLDPGADQVAADLRRRLDLDEALAVSVRSGDGLPTLRALLAPEATIALLGTSGAGKSTLVNTLLGEERQATAPVREKDGLGRHTTVTRELIELPGGALLLDTPGLREIGLWDGAGTSFDEIERLAAQCHFTDCGHLTEPGCAVRDAVAPDRLAAWRELAAEQARLDARRRG
jgi:ribosome biogenesis GTPase / thiamine phosphate phosphatase